MIKRKRLLVFLLFVVSLYFLISGTYSTNEGLIEEFITRNISELNSVLENKSDINNPYALTEIADENGNVPAYKYYNDLKSRSIKELSVYDNKIFMGIGNWNDNTGPVKIIYYNTETEKIETSGTISDEAVQSFNIINDKLYTTGVDPRDAWGYGSYYVYNKESNLWDKYMFNDGWIHVFDIESFNDKLFMCGSVTASSERSPIQVSFDGGNSFEDVKVYKDGELLPYNSSLRFYALENFNNNLYARIYFAEEYDGKYSGVYKYDDENNQFDFYSRTLTYEKSEYGLAASINYNFIYLTNNVVFNDYFLFVSGNYIYKSKDFITMEKVPKTTNDVIQDVLVYEDTLYTLSYQYNEDKSFDTRIYSTKDLITFDLVYEFTIDYFPFSIEYLEDNFYIGTAYNSLSKGSERSGALYKVNLGILDKNLSLDEKNEKIDVTINGITYPVNYDMSTEDYMFETTLNFDSNMSEKEWQREFTKFENLNLIYALVDNKENVDLDKSTSYFNNVLYNNDIVATGSYSNAIEFAEDVFPYGLTIVDERFNITVDLINKTDDEYNLSVKLTVLSIDDKITSEKYIINDDESYIYIGTDTDIDIIKNNINISKNINLDIDFNTNKLFIKFNDNILKEYLLIRFSTNRKIIDKYMYVSNLNSQEILSDIITINAESFINGDSLEIIRDNVIIDKFELLFIDFKNFNVSNKIITIPEIISYDEIIDNITVSNGILYKIFDNDNEVTSVNIKNGIIKVYYDRKEIDVFDLSAGYLEFDSSINVDQDNKHLYTNYNTRVSDILAKISTSGSIRVTNNVGEELDSDNLIGTASKIIIKLGVNTYEYFVIIKGDVNGDGTLSLDDVNLIADYVYNEKKLTDLYLEAADYDSNNFYDLMDIMKVANKIYKGGN